jgi:hypothetical protein
MTKQPNQFAAGLRHALDIARDRRDQAERVAAMVRAEGHHTSRLNAGIYQLNELIDTLSDQLLDAGGFLGIEDEPQERAYIIDRNGQVMASYDVDELDPDIYAEQFAAASGFDISDDDGRIPDGCEDFSVRIAEAPDAVRCWTSRNYMMKGE